MISKVAIEERLAKIDFGRMQVPSEQEIMAEINAGRRGLLESRFPEKLKRRDSKYFEWMWAQVAPFAHQTYNAIEIAYWLNLCPFTVACYISHHGIDYAYKMVFCKRLHEVDRGEFTILVPGQLWSIALMKHRFAKRTASTAMQRKVLQALRASYLYPTISDYAPAILAMNDNSREHQIFKDKRYEDHDLTSGAGKLKGDSNHYVVDNQKFTTNWAFPGARSPDVR